MELFKIKSPPSVKLIQLAYSGGKASQALLEMILRGELVPDRKLIVTCANPGMEDVRTYFITADAERRCKAAGIPFLRANVDLYRGLLEAKKSGVTRFDFPAFFTKNKETGKIGMMMQSCTGWCKIAPMDRLARNWMDANMGISKKSKRIGEEILCKWIGFSFSEVMRIKPHKKAKYVRFDYPLAELGLKDEHILEMYKRWGVEPPPRSVCSACFANDEVYFKDMYETRPTNWAQAVAIDEEIRDLSQFSMRDECYVYAGCIPLKELARLGFPKIERPKSQKCHTGHCFI